MVSVCSCLLSRWHICIDVSTSVVSLVMIEWLLYISSNTLLLDLLLFLRAPVFKMLKSTCCMKKKKKVLEEDEEWFSCASEEEEAAAPVVAMKRKRQYVPII